MKQVGLKWNCKENSLEWKNPFITRITEEIPVISDDTIKMSTSQRLH